MHWVAEMKHELHEAARKAAEMTDMAARREAEIEAGRKEEMALRKAAEQRESQEMKRRVEAESKEQQLRKEAMRTKAEMRLMREEMQALQSELAKVSTVVSSNRRSKTSPCSSCCNRGTLNPGEAVPNGGPKAESGVVRNVRGAL